MTIQINLCTALNLMSINHIVVIFLFCLVKSFLKKYIGIVNKKIISALAIDF